MSERRTDMYGTEEATATQTLERFLREDLREPEASLVNLGLVDGHWQSDVAGSQRGIKVVFLREHAGKLAPGHMTEDYHPEEHLNKG